VWCWYADAERWYSGIIAHHNMTNQDLYTVAFDDGSLENNIQRSNMEHYHPVTEGDIVEGCYNDEGTAFDDCYPGRVVRVMPSGHVSISFDDGDTEWSVSRYRYYIPPFFHDVVS
jgi:hypothetical protein